VSGNKKLIPMKKELLLLICAFITVVSCTNEKKTKETGEKKIPIIDIEKAIEHLSSQKLNFSEFIDDITYIPLQTTDKSIIGGRFEPPLCVTENYIFHGDMMFRRDGSFVRKLGKTGQGPGEYLLALGIAADEKRQEFYVYDNNLHNIFIYDFENHFKKQIPAPDSGSSIFLLGNGKIILLREKYGFFNNFYEYKVIDIDHGEVIYTRNPGVIENSSALLYNLICHYKQETIYYEVSTDTIFNLDKNGKIDIPRYYVNFGKYKYKYEYKNPNNNTLRLGKILETNMYLLFSISKGYDLYYGAYNKQTGETIINQFGEFFNNDIDGGFLWLCNSASNGLEGFYSIFPFLAKERIGTLSQQNKGYDKEKNQKLRQLIDRVKEDDNTIYYFLKLK